MRKKVEVDVPDVKAALADIKDLVSGLREVTKAQGEVGRASRKSGAAARSAAQSLKSNVTQRFGGSTQRFSGPPGSTDPTLAMPDPNKTGSYSRKDYARQQAQYARQQARQQVADQKAATKAARQAHQQDPGYIRSQALMRARYTYGKNGKVQAHLLGVDIKKLVNSGQSDLVHQMMGGNDPAGGGGIDPATMGINVANAAAGAVTSGVGGGTSSAFSSAHAVAMAMSGLGKLGPYAMVAAGAIKVLGASSEYAGKQVEGQAKYGSGYNPLAENYGGITTGGYKGYSAAAAAAAGINPVGGPYGNINYAGNKAKELNRIGNAPSYEEARRRDIELHNGQETGAAKFWDLDPANKTRATDTRGMSPENRKAAANAEANFDNFKKDLLDTGVSLGSRIINFLFSDEGKVKGASTDFGPRGSSQKKDLAQALDDHAKVMEDNTRAIDYNTQGFSSDVRGATGAVPAGMRNNSNLQKNGMDMATADGVRLNTGL